MISTPNIQPKTKSLTGLILYSNKGDPTRTLTLRNAFVRDMKRRFKELIRAVWQSINTEDVFGLKMQANVLPTAGQQAFAFQTSAQKVESFMRWFRLEVEKGVLETKTFEQVGVGVESAWTNIYVTDTYKKGVIRSRYEMKKAGFGTPGIVETGGIEMSMMAPMHLDRMGLLYSRVYNELRGITAAMDTQISRILSQGIADGDNPITLARKLVAAIDGTGMGKLGLTDTLGRFIPAMRRAEILARTEVIRAHHQGMIQEYRNWGVEGVTVQAEWITAGDNRVCAQCDAMVGNGDLPGGYYSLDAISPLIPVHPQCRCMALPIKL